MDAENFAGYYGGYGETIEYVDKCFPNFDARTTFTFIVEAIYLRLTLYQDFITSCDVCTFVVSAEEEEIFGPS